jgi:hypothetical protein
MVSPGHCIREAFGSADFLSKDRHVPASAGDKGQARGRASSAGTAPVLAHLQSEWLARTQADLLENPRLRDTALLFLSDINGPKDMDKDLNQHLDAVRRLGCGALTNSSIK